MARPVRLAISAAMLLASAAHHAGAADGKDAQCFSAAEAGQKLQRQGNLKEAEEKFQVCADAACPTVVLQDCTKWHTDVMKLLPTVTLAAKDAAGKDLIDVRVSVDDSLLASQLDGKSLTLNPGVHVFRFETASASPITERVVLSEGEKLRKVAVQFGASDTGSGRPFPIGPVLLGGVGIAGIVVGALVYSGASSETIPADCNPDTLQCTKPESLNIADDILFRERVGMATIIGGSALLAGGITWFIVSRMGPSEKKPAEARIIPLIAPTSVGALWRF